MVSNFDLWGSDIPRKARSDIVAKATVILLGAPRSDIIFACK